MRAAVVREFGEDLVIEDLDLAAPEPDEVRVRISACAICHSDIAYLDGKWGGELPMVLGHEAAGFVADIGTAVTDFTPGDRVVVSLVRSCGRCRACRLSEPTQCEGTFLRDDRPPLRTYGDEAVTQGLRTGAFAEEVLVHESQLAHLPDGIPDTAGALLACGVITGFGAVTRTADVPPGASVTVVGVGGVGLNAIQGAVNRRATQIIAVDVNDEKLQWAIRLGATTTVNARDVAPAEAVARLTAGRGTDFVFAAVGSAPVIESSLHMVRRGGTLVIVGMPPTGAEISIDAGDLAAKGQRIIGSKMGSTNLQKDVAALGAAYLEGRLELDSLISATYSLEQINDAIDSARAGQAIRNVVVIDDV